MTRSTTPSKRPATTAGPLAPGDLVGLQEIAVICGVHVNTPRLWRSRGVLPEPWATVSGSPVWLRGDIEEWWRERSSG